MPDPKPKRLTPLQEREEYFGRQRLEALGFTGEFARKVKTRIDEGLDAVSVKVWQNNGEVIADAPRVDYTERRLAAELGARILDWMPNKLEHEVHGDLRLITRGLSEDDI